MARASDGAVSHSGDCGLLGIAAEILRNTDARGRRRRARAGRERSDAEEKKKGLAHRGLKKQAPCAGRPVVDVIENTRDCLATDRRVGTRVDGQQRHTPTRASLSVSVRRASTHLASSGPVIRQSASTARRIEPSARHGLSHALGRVSSETALLLLRLSSLPVWLVGGGGDGVPAPGAPGCEGASRAFEEEPPKSSALAWAMSS